MNETANPKRILIADDDPVARSMLRALLAKWGYDVVQVSDGIEALRILEGPDAPELVILDWMMPGAEGPEICERVRALSDRPYVYILLVTSRSHRTDIANGLESGADDFLTKPFDADELRARLRVGLRLLELQHSLIAAREELRFKATHDALTGIANRAAVLEAVNRERSRQIREGSPFGIVLIDVDHFKQVNDGCGHLAGDVVLKTIAERLASCVRPYDTVGRYGGEEFLVVAPLSDPAGTMSLAERIRKRIEDTSVDTSYGPISITVSCGVAASVGNEAPEIHALLYLADEALYRAKSAGRNRCELGSIEPVLPASTEKRRR
ncbi:MAG TPA: diguanylate cyclase [Candidatus Acidoferrales bacterium]|jgi:diguanylate cyclase (GGDEF)-like protein|nr:diguanylate cyclase [Candidatus Acidoferrales bacterium]